MWSQPKNAAPYLDRNRTEPGLLHAGDAALRVFTRSWLMLGRSLANSLQTLMFNAIADHVPELTPVVAPKRLRSSMINGIKHWQVNYGTG